jgi:hypothetical protein
LGSNSAIVPRELEFNIEVMIGTGRSTERGEAMTRVIVDPVTRAKLANAHNPLELCDDSGNVLGHFIPLPESTRGDKREPQIGEEELDRRERAGGGRGFAEIMADLERNG